MLFRSLSEEDLRELRQASGSQEEQRRESVGMGPHDWEHKGVRFSVAEGTFAFQYSFVDLNIYAGVAIPDPLAIPDDYSHVIGSGTIYWRTTSPPKKPVKISIPYTDEELKGGDNMYFGDLHNFVPPALDEDTLTVMRFVQRPFGQESDTPDHWEKVEGAVVDKQNNLVTFETTQTGIYGISGKTQTNQVGPVVLQDGPKNVLIVVLLLATGATIFYFFKKRKSR